MSGGSAASWWPRRWPAPPLSSRLRTCRFRTRPQDRSRGWCCSSGWWSRKAFCLRRRCRHPPIRRECCWPGRHSCWRLPRMRRRSARQGDITNSTPFFLAARGSPALRGTCRARRSSRRPAALCGCEGVGHAAADDDRIDLLDQGLDDADLRRHLRTADDGAERMRRGLHRARRWPSPPFSIR